MNGVIDAVTSYRLKRDEVPSRNVDAAELEDDLDEPIAFLDAERRLSRYGVTICILERPRVFFLFVFDVKGSCDLI